MDSFPYPVSHLSTLWLLAENRSKYMLANCTVWVILYGLTQTSRTELMATFGTGRIFEAIQTDGTVFLCVRMKYFARYEIGIRKYICRYLFQQQ